MNCKTITMVSGFIFVLSAFYTASVLAANPKPSAAAAVGQKQEVPTAKETVKVTFKEASGTISALSKNFIAVVTGVDPMTKVGTESAFNLDANVRIVHKRSIDEIGVGDTVKVGYEETVKMTDGKRTSRSTMVKSITFLRAAPKEQVSKEPEPKQPAAQVEQPQEELSASEGDEPDAGSLTLKGLRGR